MLILNHSQPTPTPKRFLRCTRRARGVAGAIFNCGPPKIQTRWRVVHREFGLIVFDRDEAKAFGPSGFSVAHHDGVADAERRKQVGQLAIGRFP